MSEAVSVLNHAHFQGLVTVEEAGLQGMITLRGDLSSAALKKAVKQAIGLGLPSQRKIVLGDGTALAWMSPDELLLLLPYADAADMSAKLAVDLKAEHALVQNVSDARSLFTLQGEQGAVREVLAKLAPVDLSPEAFQPGDFRRTRLAQIAGAFWLAQSDRAQIICFRSVAQYAFELLKNAADKGGKVGYY